ncbi:sigma-70 family RNA polymerase sigma factor [Candidatus Poribacteria bacterium]|nr:sigma-70 family RNA polymerase sigma factor [Candidatus Poribacteria bacterium]
MKLRCQWKGKKCPPYTHEGVFEANNETLISFERDLNRCAQCIAYENPVLPSFQEDLLQMARIILWQKGPLFDPNHETKASFRTYILPWICGKLAKAKKREVQHCQRFMPPSSEGNFPYETSEEIKPEPLEHLISCTVDPQSNFVDKLIYEMWNADFEKYLPELLQGLTKREKQIFTLIRVNMKQCDIAETLALSKPRVSQLLKQVERKMRRACQNLGLLEDYRK